MNAPHILAAMASLAVSALAMATMIHQLGRSWPQARAYLLLEPTEPSLGVDLAGFASIAAAVLALLVITGQLHA